MELCFDVLGAFLPSVFGRARDADLLIKTSPDGSKLNVREDMASGGNEAEHNAEDRLAPTAYGVWEGMKPYGYTDISKGNEELDHTRHSGEVCGVGGYLTRVKRLTLSSRHASITCGVCITHRQMTRIVQARACS